MKVLDKFKNTFLNTESKDLKFLKLFMSYYTPNFKEHKNGHVYYCENIICNECLLHKVCDISIANPPPSLIQEEDIKLIKEQYPEYFV